MDQKNAIPKSTKVLFIFTNWLCVMQTRRTVPHIAAPPDPACHNFVFRSCAVSGSFYNSSTTMTDNPEFGTCPARAIANSRLPTCPMLATCQLAVIANDGATDWRTFNLGQEMLTPPRPWRDFYTCQVDSKHIYPFWRRIIVDSVCLGQHQQCLRQESLLLYIRTWIIIDFLYLRPKIKQCPVFSSSVSGRSSEHPSRVLLQLMSSCSHLHTRLPYSSMKLGSRRCIFVRIALDLVTFPCRYRMNAKPLCQTIRLPRALSSIQQGAESTQHRPTLAGTGLTRPKALWNVFHSHIAVSVSQYYTGFVQRSYSPASESF